MSKIIPVATSLLLLSSVLTACDGGGSNTTTASGNMVTDTDTTSTTGSVLKIDAGPDQVVDEKDSVTLSATAAGEGILSYEWSVMTGGPIPYVATTTLQRSPVFHFFAPYVSNIEQQSNLVFKVKVVSLTGETAEDTVTVTVRNSNDYQPSYEVADYQEVIAGREVQLLSKAEDLDNDLLVYQWTQTGGEPQVNLQNADQPIASFVAPSTAEESVLSFTLTISQLRGEKYPFIKTVRMRVLADEIVQPTPTGKLNDTGQARCIFVDDAHVSPYLPYYSLPFGDCLYTAYTGQDGTLGRDVTHNDDIDGEAGFSFTPIDATGATWVHDPTNTQPQHPACIKDNVTGLIWEVKTNSGLHNSVDRYTWYEPDTTKNGEFAGFERWSEANITATFGDTDDSCKGYTLSNNATYCNTHAYVQRVNAEGWCGAHDWRLPTVEEQATIASETGIASGYFLVNYLYNRPPYAAET